MSSLYYSGDFFFNRSIASWGVNTLCTNQLSNDFEKGQTNSICDDDRAKNPYWNGISMKNGMRNNKTFLNMFQIKDLRPEGHSHTSPQIIPKIGQKEE